MDQQDKKQVSEELEQEACPSIFDKPDPERFRKNEKPPKKGNRQIRSIIVALVLCVTIVASTTGISYLLYDKDPISFLKEYLKGEEESSETPSTPEAEQRLIHDYSTLASEIETVRVVQPKETYEMKSFVGTSVSVNPQTMEEEETETIQWVISKVEGKNISGVKFSPTLCGFVATDIMKIPYHSVYAENGNDRNAQGDKTYFEECGITNSKNRLTMKFKSGGSITVVLGDKAPTDDFYFLAIEAEGTLPNDAKAGNQIYKVTQDAIAYYAKDTIYFVDKEIVTPVEQDEPIFVEETGETIEDSYFISGELSKFDQLTVTGSGYRAPFSFKMVDQDQPGYDSIYLMTSPVTQNVDLDSISNLLSPMANGLTANECLVMQPTSAQLQEYGFGNPLCKVRYVIKGKETVLIVGKQLSGATTTYSVMVKGNSSIYSISQGSIPFVTYTQADYASDTMYSCDITLVNTLRIQSQGKDELYRLKHGVDAQGNKTLTVTTREGKTVNTEAFRSMYVQLLSLTSFTNVTDGKDSATPYATITLTYNGYSKTDVIRLSPYTDRRYYMSLNGMGSTVVLSNSVDEFIDAFKALG